MKKIFLFKISVLICVAISMFAFAKAKNPKNYDFIEWQGWGDWNGVMTGRITDENGNPIPYAKIKVHSKNIQTTADKNGFFTIKGLQQGGHYSLIVKGKGFDGAIARWIPIPVDHSADIGDFQLEPEKIWTNFWVVTSNKLENNCWAIVSNYFDITDGITNIYTPKEFDFYNPPDLHIYDYPVETNETIKVVPPVISNNSPKTSKSSLTK